MKRAALRISERRDDQELFSHQQICPRQRRRGRVDENDAGWRFDFNIEGRDVTDGGQKHDINHERDNKQRSKFHKPIRYLIPIQFRHLTELNLRKFIANLMPFYIGVKDV